MREVESACRDEPSLVGDRNSGEMMTLEMVDDVVASAEECGSGVRFGEPSCARDHGDGREIGASVVPGGRDR